MLGAWESKQNRKGSDRSFKKMKKIKTSLSAHHFLMHAIAIFCSLLISISLCLYQFYATWPKAKCTWRNDENCTKLTCEPMIETATSPKCSIIAPSKPLSCICKSTEFTVVMEKYYDSRWDHRQRPRDFGIYKKREESLTAYIYILEFFFRCQTCLDSRELFNHYLIAL